MIKAEHAGDTCSAFSDVVNFVVGRTQDFAGSAVVVDVPGVRKNDSEHFYTSVDGKVWRTVYYRFATREEREGKVSTNLIFKECRQSAVMKRVLMFWGRVGV